MNDKKPPPQQIQKRTARDEFMAPVEDAKTLAELVVSAEQQLQAASGGRVDAAKLARLSVLTRMAAQRNPDLLKCTRESLFWAFLDAARAGLEWDGEQGALVPYWNNKLQKKEAKFLPMYRGLIHLLAESGVCIDIRAVPVFRGDVFKVEQGTVNRIIHEPDYGADRNDDTLVACYAVFVLRDGTVRFDVMARQDLVKRRDASRAKDAGPWKDWFIEMCLKTVIKHGQKLLPRLSERARDAIVIDNRYESGDRSLSGEEQRVLPPGLTAGDLAGAAAKQKGLAGLKEALGGDGETLGIPPGEMGAPAATEEQLKDLAAFSEMQFGMACREVLDASPDTRPATLTATEAAAVLDYLKSQKGG